MKKPKGKGKTPTIVSAKLQAAEAADKEVARTIRKLPKDKRKTAAVAQAKKEAEAPRVVDPKKTKPNVIVAFTKAEVERLAKASGKPAPKVQVARTKTGKVAKVAVDLVPQGKVRGKLNGIPVKAPAKRAHVYVNEHRDSAIVTEIRLEGEQVVFVTMDNCFVDRYKLPRADFERRYLEVPGYPLDRAVAIYRRVGGEERITERAKRALELMLNPKLKTQSEEDDERKADMKAAKSKAPKVKKEKVDFLTKDAATKLLTKGGKLKKVRENDRREGSIKRAALDAILACASIKAALEKTYKFKGKTVSVKSSDVRSAIRRKYVAVA